MYVHVCRLIARRTLGDPGMPYNEKWENLWSLDAQIFGGKEIILNDLPKIYKYIWKEIALIFNIIIHLTFWPIWSMAAWTREAKMFEKSRMERYTDADMK